MITALVITGTGNSALGTVREILARRFVAASRDTKALRTWGKLSHVWQLDIAGNGQRMSIDGGGLAVIRSDTSANTRIFVLTVVTDSQEFAELLRRDFADPGFSIDIKSRVSPVVGTDPTTPA
jgi:hypothetical protein